MSDSFQNLVGRLQSNDQQAAADVWQRFAPHLNRLAQRRLRGRLQNEAEDAVQSAFRSFFVGLQGREFQFENWDSLSGLLARITLRKCIRRIEYHRAERRDIRRNVSASQDAGAGQALEELHGELAPHVRVALEETLNVVIAGLTPLQLDIFLLSLQDMPTDEIAASVSRTERTVQRVLKQIRNRLETLWTGED